LKLIVSSSEKSTLIIAFELLFEFMEHAHSKIVFKFNSSIGNWLHFLFKTAMYSFSVCLKPSVEDFRSEINSSVSESVI
jgi:hypothetical protein